MESALLHHSRSVLTAASIFAAVLAMPLLTVALFGAAQMSGVNTDQVIEKGVAEVEERAPGWDPAVHWEQIYEESNGISGAPSLGSGMDFGGSIIGLIGSLVVVLA
jgi:hypothetical protein